MTDVTRSVEIPEAAVEAAALEFYDVAWHIPDSKLKNRRRAAMRGILEAALPYLAPAEPVADRERAAQRMWELHAQEQSWEELSDLGKDQMRSEADEVLRFAGIHSAGDGGDGGLREALRARAADLDAAVSQPVDREVLRDALIGMPTSRAATLGAAEAAAIADRVLAVLAGEQDQAHIANPDAIQRCPARGYADEPCVRPALHDGSHEWFEDDGEQEQVEK